MKFLVAIFFLLAASTLGAQTANVIELEPSDAAKAQKAYADLQAAQLFWDSTSAYIGRKYAHAGNCVTTDSQNNITGGWGPCAISPVSGFENGFEFSKDFKYIVPKPREQKPTINFGGNTVLTPYSPYSGSVGTLQLD